jgi:tetratricopeptide (TPR) repeat protein
MSHRVLNRSLVLAFLSCIFACTCAHARTYADVAESLFQSGHREDAVRAMGQAIKQTPKNGFLYTTRGRYLLRGEEYVRALPDFTKAIEMDPSQRQDWIYRMRADCYVNLGNFQAAIADLKKAIALKPHDEYYKMLGEVYYQLKRLDEAADSFSKGIAINSKNYWLFKIRGDVYFQQGKFQKAVNDYTSVIRIVPKDPVGYGARARAYERLGLHALADKDIAKTKIDVDFMKDDLK